MAFTQVHFETLGDKQLFRTGVRIYPLETTDSLILVVFFPKGLKLLFQHNRNWWIPWVQGRKTPCHRNSVLLLRYMGAWEPSSNAIFKSSASPCPSCQPPLGFFLNFPFFPLGPGSTERLQRDDRDAAKAGERKTRPCISNEDSFNICPQPQMYSPAQTHSSDEALKYLLPKYQSS